MLPTHTWKKGRECRLPPQATGHTPTALWVFLSCLGLLCTLLVVRLCSVTTEVRGGEAESSKAKTDPSRPIGLSILGSGCLAQRL